MDNNKNNTLGIEKSMSIRYFSTVYYVLKTLNNRQQIRGRP